jgi:hypothetical protein
MGKSVEAESLLRKACHPESVAVPEWESLEKRLSH